MPSASSAPGAVALGVVSVIAANWGAISGRTKLAIDLALGALLAAATFVAVQRERTWVGEVLITLFYGFTLASIGLVGQVYQLDAPTYQGLLLWSAATLPLVLLGRSRYLAALVLVRIRDDPCPVAAGVARVARASRRLEQRTPW
jgi:uncharacterized membrane protein